MSRKRYRYNPETKAMEEMGAAWTDAPRSTGDLGKFEYDNLRATDGTDISSRTKMRDYLKATGLAVLSDYRETLPKAQARREAAFTGAADKRERREAVGRALYSLRKGKR